MSELNIWKQPVGDYLPDWQGAEALPRDTLDGRYCTLVPLDENLHTRALFQAYSTAEDERDWTWLTTGRPESPDAMRAWIAEKTADTSLVPYAVIDNRTGEAVGIVCFMRIDRGNGVVEIGHVTWSPLMKRSRTGTEALWLLLDSAFRHGYRRVEWKCDSLNEPSRLAAERLGFSFEGRFRQAIVRKQRNRDTDWLSLLDREWPEANAAISRWLAADNFDESGQQKSKLAVKGSVSA